MEKLVKTHKYDDIIDLPHPEFKYHKRMSMEQRAAQFAPFQALSGYGDALEETARLTERFVEPSEQEQAALNEKLRRLEEIIKDRPVIACTVFVPDSLKEGGSYQLVTGKARRIDPVMRQLILEDGRQLDLGLMVSLDCSELENQTFHDIMGEMLI